MVNCGRSMLLEFQNHWLRLMQHFFSGQAHRSSCGKNERDLVVVIEFSDRVSLDNWFNPEKYQSLIALRDIAVDVVITTYDAC